MKYAGWFVVMCLAVSACTGCHSMSGRMASEHKISRIAMLARARTDDVGSQRMLIWRARLTVCVKDVAHAVAEAKAAAKRAGGYVQEQSGGDERHARLTIRLPVPALKDTVAGLEALGTVTERNVNATDVTERYVDTEARLKSKIALRDRLQKLLDRAGNVPDVLAIERELTRVQADIESMQARLRVLKGQADLATVHLTLRRRRILGPVAFVLKYTFWAVGKLFVIQD